MSKKILLGAICTVLFCGTSATVFAQDNAPSGAAPSLLNSADPRAAGMGMATTAVNDNPFGIFGNAASNLLSEKRMGFGYSYNVGTKLDISVPSNPIAMPAYAKLGGSIDMPFSENHKLLAALDLGYTFMPSTDASFTAGLGLEYNFLKHGFLRAGYHYGDEKSIGGSYATVGLGAAVGPVRVDASYWIAGKESPVKNTWAVGLSLFF